MGRRWRGGWALLVVVGGMATVARAGRYEELSALERKLVDRALAAYRVEPEPEPAGKTVGRVLIFTGEVFDDEQPWLEPLNALTPSTDDDVVAREVLLEPGDRYDEDRLVDSERLLRDPTFRSVVVLLPVRARRDPVAGVVDVLVVTRDIWALRLEGDVESTDGEIDRLNASLSHGNLFGRNKLAAADFVLGDTSFRVGGRYLDPRLVGSRLRLDVDQSLVFDRDDRELLGFVGGASVERPLFSRDERWGYGADARYFLGTGRDVLGSRVLVYDDPDTAEVEAVEARWDELTVAGGVGVTRSFGEDRKHEVGLDYRFAVSRYQLEDGFADDAALRAAFTRDVLPDDELVSSVRARYDLFENRFTFLYDVDTFGLAEQFRLGPRVGLTASLAARALGGDENFGSLGVSGGWVLEPVDDGLLAISVAGASLVDGGFPDRSVGALLRWYGPQTFGLARLIVRASTTVQAEATERRLFTIGGSNGLRGYPADVRVGEHLMSIRSELRTAPLMVRSLAIGGVLFWDVGDAFDDADDLRPLHSAGAGLRFVWVSLSRRVLRLDFGVPLEAGAGLGDGLVTFGFDQTF